MLDINDRPAPPPGWKYAPGRPRPAAQGKNSIGICGVRKGRNVYDVSFGARTSGLRWIITRERERPLKAEL